MADWKLYKGQGPWPFAPQQNKWGYVNNPRWLEPPSTPISYDGREDEEPQVWDMTQSPKVGRADARDTHEPCGHWHRPIATPEPIYDVNLFRVTDPWLAFGSIQSLFFNTTAKTLSLVNYYVDSPGVCAIEVIGDRVYTIKGRYDTAQLLELDRFLNITNTYNIFNYYDCTGPRNYHLCYHDGFLYWSSADSDQPTVIGRISYPGFIRDSRFTPGAVFTGTDGNLWQYNYTYGFPWGQAVYYPITGNPLSYDSVNEQILDNDHSGPIITWGAGSQGTGTGSSQSLHVRDGVIYISASASPYSKVYAYQVSGYVLNNRITPSSSNYAFTVYKSINGYLYCSSGTLDNFIIDRYDGGLNFINRVSYPSYGRVVYTYQICDLGSYIVVGTDIYTDDCGIVLLNSDLSLVRFVSTRDLGFNSSQCVIAYGNFLFVGEHNHISAWELVGDALVFLDRIYVDFVPHVDIGFTSKWLKLMLVPR